MRCALGEANHGPACSKVVSSPSQTKHNEYTPEVRWRREGMAPRMVPRLLDKCKYSILAEITNLLPINFSHYMVWLNKWSACETWIQVLHHYQNKGTPISCLPSILWHVSRTCSWLTIATMCTECSTDDLFSYYTWTFNGCNLYLCTAQYSHGLQIWVSYSTDEVTLPCQSPYQLTLTLWAGAGAKLSEFNTVCALLALS